ncbi:hypothetical protein X798_02385 [Onchocerca flexuosa]|uniref:Uncharacterized protein n=1 Tax=Onchocerca flexuosa TaxID=387005 RepID=A0A238C0H5_9BILA|nr:hypothetical protein X798_02385 [Onchocerca flexuosa]
MPVTATIDVPLPSETPQVLLNFTSHIMQIRHSWKLPYGTVENCAHLHENWTETPLIEEYKRDENNTTDEATLTKIFGTANGTTRNMRCKPRHTNAP